MEENPNYVLCGSYSNVISDVGEFIFTAKDIPLSDTEIRNKINEKNCFYHPSTFYKREQALQIGGYYQPINCCHIVFEDYMFFYQLIKKGKASNIPEALIKYRLSPGSLSNFSNFSNNRKYLSLVKRAVFRGFITDEEKDYLNSFNKKKPTGKTKMSNYYLNIARYFLTYQSDLSKVKYYLFLAIKASPLNPNILIHGLYMVYIQVTHKIILR